MPHSRGFIMVSIIIVSHSKRLAQGIVELATQMVQGSVKIEIAAGINDPENPIGTDTIAIIDAIEKVYCDDGVLLMVDMGSAILSAEMALEMIDPDQAEKCTYLCGPYYGRDNVSCCGSCRRYVYRKSHTRGASCINPVNISYYNKLIF